VGGVESLAAKDATDGSGVDSTIDLSEDSLFVVGCKTASEGSLDDFGVGGSEAEVLMLNGSF
jgi:hypothetical protein